MNDRNYFPGLDGLRAVFYIIIFIFHVELTKSALGLPSICNFYETIFFGEYAITGFYVLSGFLITLLLLKEKSTAKGISAINFYKRRILRIWPAYYFYIFIVLVFLYQNFLFYTSLPQFESAQRLYGDFIALHILGLPNVAFLMTIVPVLSHTWTVGTEEQYYVIWPIVLRYVKNILPFLVTLVIIISGVKLSYHYIKINFSSEGSFGFWPDVIEDFFYYFRIECMAVGGIMSYLFMNNKFTALLYSNLAQVLSIVGLIGVHVFGWIFSFATHPLYSVFIGVLIINIAGNPDSILRLSSRILVYFGKISYATYLYHMLAIVVVSKSVLFFCSGAGIAVQNVLIYFISFTLTLLLGSISHYLIEKPFLRLKGKLR